MVVKEVSDPSDACKSRKSRSELEGVMVGAKVETVEAL
jgi:hypothetical protein